MAPWTDRNIEGTRPLKKAFGPSFTAMSFMMCQITLPGLPLAPVACYCSLKRARRVLTTHIGVVKMIATIEALSEMITVVHELGFDGS